MCGNQLRSIPTSNNMDYVPDSAPAQDAEDSVQPILKKSSRGYVSADEGRASQPRSAEQVHKRVSFGKNSTVFVVESFKDYNKDKNEGRVKMKTCCLPSCQMF